MAEVIQMWNKFCTIYLIITIIIIIIIKSVAGLYDIPYIHDYLTVINLLKPAIMMMIMMMMMTKYFK